MHPTQNCFALLRIFFAKEITALYVEQHFKPSHPAQAMPVHRSWTASLARTDENETWGEHCVPAVTLRKHHSCQRPVPVRQLRGGKGQGDEGSA